LEAEELDYLWSLFLNNFFTTTKIILMITILMIIIEYLELKFQDKIREKITNRPMNQYLIASVLGTIPGCLDAFFIVSLYTHGLVGFGALVSVMLSTAGDEAFIMLAMIPNAALKIFAICLILGIIGGILADKIIKLLNVKIREHCIIEIHEEETNLHFLREHVYKHILKEHVPRLFLWIFFPLTVVDYLIMNFDLASIIEGLPVMWLIFISAVVGIIPESGPHMIFLVLYSKGLIPFSVLLVSTLSQDGHGLLPLLSHSIKDTIFVQIFTTGFSLIIGIILYLISI
jgi:hypothetical protein